MLNHDSLSRPMIYYYFFVKLEVTPLGLYYYYCPIKTEIAFSVCFD